MLGFAVPMKRAACDVGHSHRRVGRKRGDWGAVDCTWSGFAFLMMGSLTKNRQSIAGDGCWSWVAKTSRVPHVSSGREAMMVECLASMGVGVSLTWAHRLPLCPPSAAIGKAKAETGGEQGREITSTWPCTKPGQAHNELGVGWGSPAAKQLPPRCH